MKDKIRSIIKKHETSSLEGLSFISEWGYDNLIEEIIEVLIEEENKTKNILERLLSNLGNLKREGIKSYRGGDYRIALYMAESEIIGELHKISTKIN